MRSPSGVVPAGPIPDIVASSMGVANLVRKDHCEKRRYFGELLRSNRTASIVQDYLGNKTNLTRQTHKTEKR